MLDDFIILIMENKRKALGAIIGFIIAILVLIFGFFSTIFIIFLTVLGYIVSDNEEIRNCFNNILERFKK